MKVELKKSSFDVAGPFVNVHLNMNITGLFNVYNTLAAIGAAHAEGVDEATIDKAIQPSTPYRAVLNSSKLVRISPSSSTIPIRGQPAEGPGNGAGHEAEPHHRRLWLRRRPR